MSGFKRMQSRVFWGHMEAQDLDKTPLLGGTSSRLLQTSYCNFGRDTDTEKDSDTSREGDELTGNSMSMNITAIRINEVIEEGSEVQLRTSIEGSLLEVPEDVEDNVEEIENPGTGSAVEQCCRSSGQQCQGHGSLDSGFSDSERSKSPDIMDNGAPRRQRRRRRRSRDRPRVNPRVNALFREHDLLHTSTPKREFPGARSRQSMMFTSDEERELLSRRIEEEREETAIRPGDVIPQEEECLGDFLYAQEPPEDDIPTSSSTSRGSTPSFAGPWYSRLSNERSGSSGSSPRISSEARCQESVKVWLRDLAEDYEPECCVALQSKALPKRREQKETSEESQSRDLRLMTATATAAATELIIRADGFSKHIRDVIDKVSHLESGRSERELLRSIEEEAFSLLSELGAPPPRRIHEGSLRSILSQLESLENVVNCTVNTRLDFYIERVVRGLEDAPEETGSAARGALAALTALGLAGTRAGSSIARCAGVRALLTSLISAGRLSSELRASTLRALSSVCCCPLAINRFVKEGGPEILVDLLASKTSPEKEKMEAAALVVQITAPWTDALGLRHLEPFANILVDILTSLAEETKCGQTLLLSAAALNNLGDSKKCVYSIVKCDTVRKLLKCVKKSVGGSIWLMEQVASLVGKLAKIPDVRGHLAKARASVALVCFLRMAPPGLEEAYQRLAVTAAAALTRLCVDPEIAKQVVAVGGADCLPNYNSEEGEDEEDQVGLLRYTRSLRIACRKAAKHIDEAKACDYSM
ncbi:protein inscuteable homolog [Diachasma alloeum]|uniref:protein inscuteable homolog n=1 Tax=Diachasma alloeum TaxID=454923 RepID=UPI0007382CB9|nr:protein inscuteable homolog [Diachasma alloeum]